MKFLVLQKKKNAKPSNLLSYIFPFKKVYHTQTKIVKCIIWTLTEQNNNVVIKIQIRKYTRKK